MLIWGTIQFQLEFWHRISRDDGDKLQDKTCAAYPMLNRSIEITVITLLTVNSWAARTEA